MTFFLVMCIIKCTNKHKTFLLYTCIQIHKLQATVNEYIITWWMMKFNILSNSIYCHILGNQSVSLYWVRTVLTSHLSVCLQAYLEEGELPEGSAACEPDAGRRLAGGQRWRGGWRDKVELVHLLDSQLVHLLDNQLVHLLDNHLVHLLDNQLVHLKTTVPWQPSPW